MGSWDWGGGALYMKKEGLYEGHKYGNPLIKDMYNAVVVGREREEKGTILPL